MILQLICCFSIHYLFTPVASFASNRALWSLSSPTICLPMNDVSYDPFGLKTDDVSEELRDGFFGQQTLYCKRGCCGDNRAPECCAPDDDVGQKTFETYKLITVIAAGVGGLAIIGVIVVAIVKWQMKKRRLVRDIEALNRMNRMTDLKTKVKGIGNFGEDKKKKKNYGGGEVENKRAKFFTNSKKAPVVHVRIAPVETNPIPPPASYATLNPQALQTTDPSSRSSGNNPVFLPSAPPSVLAPTATAPQPKSNAASMQFDRTAGPNSFQQLPRLRLGPIAAGVTPLTAPSVLNAFSTPLSENPVVFSGPSGNDQKSSRDHNSPTSGRKSSTKSSASSTPPDIPWDDVDLLLYFSDPPRS